MLHADNSDATLLICLKFPASPRRHGGIVGCNWGKGAPKMKWTNPRITKFQFSSSNKGDTT